MARKSGRGAIAIDLLSRTKPGRFGLNKIDQNPGFSNVDSSYTQLAPHQWQMVKFLSKDGLAELQH